MAEVGGPFRLRPLAQGLQGAFRLPRVEQCVERCQLVLARSFGGGGCGRSLERGREGRDLGGCRPGGRGRGLGGSLRWRRNPGPRAGGGGAAARFGGAGTGGGGRGGGGAMAISGISGGGWGAGGGGGAGTGGG